MSIQEAVTAAAKALTDHVKANSVPVPDAPWGHGASYAFNPSIEACLEIALEAALPHLPRVMALTRCQDSEDHARSFNQGYETAVAQMTAPDDRVMDATDWLEERMDEARAEGVRWAAHHTPAWSPWGLVRRWRVKAWLFDFADTIHPILPKPETPKVGTDD